MLLLHRGDVRRPSFFMWIGRPQFHPVAEVIGVDPSTLPLHRQSDGRNRTCHPQHCWSRGHAHGRRHPECFPLWQTSLRRNLPDNDQGVQADRPEDVPVAQGVAALFMIMLFGGELWLLISLKVYQTCRCWSFAAPPCFSRMVKTPCWVHSTTYSFIHLVDVVPRSSLSNIVRKVWPSNRLSRWRSRRRSVSPVSAPPIKERIEQYLPDNVDLTPELDEHYLAFHKVRHPAPSVPRREQGHVLPGSAGAVGRRAPPS